MATAAQPIAANPGIIASPLLILPNQQAAFTNLESTLRRQFAPEPGYQEFVFNHIVHAAWTQHRCACAEVELQAESLTPTRDPLLLEAFDRRLRQLATYANRAERSYHKYVKELRDAQTEARYRRQTEAAKSEPSVLTAVQQVDRAIDQSATARRRSDAALPSAAVLKARLAATQHAADPLRC